MLSKGRNVYRPLGFFNKPLFGSVGRVGASWSLTYLAAISSFRAREKGRGREGIELLRRARPPPTSPQLSLQARPPPRGGGLPLALIQAVGGWVAFSGSLAHPLYSQPPACVPSWLQAPWRASGTFQSSHYPRGCRGGGGRNCSPLPAPSFDPVSSLPLLALHPVEETKDW